MPIILLESFREEVPPWSAAGWRIACVAIGVALDVAVSSLLCPVTTGALMLQRLLGALRQLAALAEGVAACQTGGGRASTPVASGAGEGAAADALEAGKRLADDGGVAAAAERRRLQARAQKVGGRIRALLHPGWGPVG